MVKLYLSAFTMRATTRPIISAILRQIESAIKRMDPNLLDLFVDKPETVYQIFAWAPGEPA